MSQQSNNIYDNNLMMCDINKIEETKINNVIGSRIQWPKSLVNTGNTNAFNTNDNIDRLNNKKSSNLMYLYFSICLIIIFC